MSTSISDLTSYEPWFPHISGDAAAGDTSDTGDDTGGPTIVAGGTLGGDPSSVLSHLTDVMQSILAQYQEATGTSASPDDHTNDEMKSELMTDLNSELSTLESGSTAGQTTQNSTARLAQALSNMAMLMLQSYNSGSSAAGASVSMTS